MSGLIRTTMPAVDYDNLRNKIKTADLHLFTGDWTRLTTGSTIEITRVNGPNQFGFSAMTKGVKTIQVFNTLAEAITFTGATTLTPHLDDAACYQMYTTRFPDHAEHKILLIIYS